MYSHIDLEEDCVLLNGSSVRTVPSSAATAQSIPPFFVDFLHRLHRMVNEYSAELSQWSGGMRFCSSQKTLYGTKFAVTAPSATKGRPKKTQKRGKSSIQSTYNARNGGQRLSRPIFSLNKHSQTDGQQKMADLLHKSNNENLQEIQSQFSVFNDGHQNVSPNSEQRTLSSRRRAAVQPPLSIRDRIRRTLAPENLAIVANEQMPLEILEQTVAETLPESITESENYAGFLRQYLDDFQRELETDELMNIGGSSVVDQQMTDGHQIEQTLTQSQTNANGIVADVNNESSSAAAFFDADNFIVPTVDHTPAHFSTRQEDGAVQQQSLDSLTLNTNAVEVGRRKRTKPKPPSPSSSPSSAGSPVSPCENGQRNNGTEKSNELAMTSGEERQNLIRFNQSLTLIKPTKQYSYGSAGDKTPQKCVGFTRTAFPPFCASSVISSPCSFSTLKVLEHGRVKFKRTPPSPQETPTKSSIRTSPADDDKLLMATPKLLSTRRVYCNLSFSKRPRRIAPQKEGEKMKKEHEKITVSELDDELIGDVLNVIHSANPKQ